MHEVFPIFDGEYIPLYGPKTLMDTGDSHNYHAPKRGISHTTLRNAKTAAQPYKIATGDGLYPEVIPSGFKLWWSNYQLFDKENRFALGHYPEITLKVAREEAEAARKQVKQGLHPAREQELARLKFAPEPTNTFEVIAKEWIARKDWEDVPQEAQAGHASACRVPNYRQAAVEGYHTTNSAANSPESSVAAIVRQAPLAQLNTEFILNTKVFLVLFPLLEINERILYEPNACYRPQGARTAHHSSHPT
jgi:hypothetical protein